MPIAAVEKLIEAMGNEFVGLVKRSNKSQVAAPQLGWRLHQLTGSISSACTTGRHLNTEPGHYHATERGEHVVLGCNDHVSDPIVAKWDQFSFTVNTGLSQPINVLVRPPEVGNRHLNTQPFRDAVIEVKVDGLRDCSNFLMVIQDQAAVGLINRGNDTIGPVEQAHRRVIVNSIEGQKAGLGHLLLRTNHHETRHRPASCLGSPCTCHGKRKRYHAERQREDGTFHYHECPRHSLLHQSQLPATGPITGSCTAKQLQKEEAIVIWRRLGERGRKKCEMAQR